MTIRKGLLFIVLALLGALPGAAIAAPPKLAIRVEQTGDRPVSFFSLAAEPGERALAGTITVLNQDSKAVTVDLDPVNALTASNLGSAYEVRGKRISGPALWTRLSTRRLTIPAGEQASVQVTAAVPASAAAGDYLSGVGIEARGQREQSTAEKNVAVSSAQRFVVGLEVKVPGARNPEVELGNARVERQPAGVTFLVDARNTGNVILTDATGSIRVDRVGGGRVLSEEIGPGTFVTGTGIDMSALARQEQPEEGDRFRVLAELKYPGGVARLDEIVTFGRQAAETQEEFGGPEADDGLPAWLWALIAAAALVAVLATWRLLLRRRRGPLDREAAARLLERELEQTRASGRPLSVAVLDANGTGGGFASQVRRRLPGQARMGELGNGRLLLIAPDIGARGIEGLAEDLERSLADAAPGGSAPRIGTATAKASDSAEELVERASGAR